MSVVSYKNVKRPIVPVGDLPMLALFAKDEQGAWYDPSDLYNYMAPGPKLSGALGVLGVGWIKDGDGFSINGENASTSTIPLSYTGVVPGRTYAIVISYTVIAGSLRVNPHLGGGAGPYLNVGSGVARLVVVATSTALTIQAVGSGTVARVHSVVAHELPQLASATMFQDAAGTAPVTSVEQPVGLILDKSGNGNHASQSTTTARPLLSARVNKLDHTNIHLWSSGSVTVEAGQPSPFGGSDAYLLTVPVTGTYRRIYRTLASPSTMHSIYAKRGSSNFLFHHGGSGAGVTFDLDAGTARIAAALASQGVQAYITPVGGDGWYRCEVHFPTGYHSCYWCVAAGPSTTSGDEGNSVYVYGPQLEDSTRATKYQRVNSATDYDWQGWPLYLQFDGVDDALQSRLFAGPRAGNFIAAAAAVPAGESTGHTGILSHYSGGLNYHYVGYRASWMDARAIARHADAGSTAATGSPNNMVANVPVVISSHLTPGSLDRMVNTAGLIVAPSAWSDHVIANANARMGVAQGGNTIGAHRLFGCVIASDFNPDHRIRVIKQLLEKTA